MDTKNYKCPSCGAGVKYDITSKLMFCENCGQFYEVDDLEFFDEGEEPLNQAWHKDEDENSEYSFEYMDVNIFHCGSCGAEIMTNDVEVSKECAYCGQSAIMFDRVSKELRPDLILPFSMTKEEVLEIVHKRFAKAKYLADDVDNISVNSVYGIYMPYWIYDSHFEMEINGRVSTDNGTRKYSEFGETDMLVTLDASRRLNDNISLLLNPFPTDELEKFEPGYLSGFFGDRFDVSFDKRKNDARDYIADCLEEKLLSNVPGMKSKETRENYAELLDPLGVGKPQRSKERYILNDIYYAFMPVYFITFRIKSRLVNILVNGANGKVVGSVPVDERKVEKAKRQGMLIGGSFLGFFGAIMFRYMPYMWCFTLFAMLLLATALVGKKARDKYEMNQVLANTESMFSISENRE